MWRRVHKDLEKESDTKLHQDVFLNNFIYNT